MAFGELPSPPNRLFFPPSLLVAKKHKSNDPSWRHRSHALVAYLGIHARDETIGGPPRLVLIPPPHSTDTRMIGIVGILGPSSLFRLVLGTWQLSFNQIRDAPFRYLHCMLNAKRCWSFDSRLPHPPSPRDLSHEFRRHDGARDCRYRRHSVSFTWLPYRGTDGPFM